MANRSKVTLFFAVLATGIFLVSGAATCQAKDDGRAVVVAAVQGAGSHGDIGLNQETKANDQYVSNSDVGSARETDMADRSNNDIGAASDAQDSDKGDIGIAR